MFRYVLGFLFLVLLVACKESKNDKLASTDSTTTISNDLNTIVSDDSNKRVQEPESEPQYSDTLYVDKNIHEEILRTLTLIPENSMGSWNWKAADRMTMVATALSKGHIIDTEKRFMNILA